MDQQAKKHLQDEFDATLEEKDQMITVLQTQVRAGTWICLLCATKTAAVAFGIYKPKYHLLSGRNLAFIYKILEKC